MSSVATLYPGVSEGMGALSRIYGAAKAGTIAADVPRTAKDTHLFIGLGFRVTLGDPDEAAQMLTTFTDEDKQLLADASVALSVEALHAEGGSLSIPPELWTLLLPVIQALLRKLLGG